LRLLGRKALLFWNRYEAGDNLSFHYTRQVVPWLWLAPFGFWLVAPPGLAGAVAGAGAGRPEWLLRATVALIMLGTVLFHVADRYRLVAVPALIVLGVGFLRRAGLEWRQGRRARAGGRAGLVAASALLVHLPAPYPGGQDMAPFDRIMARGYAARGEPDRAARYAQEAASVYVRQGEAMLARGEPYRAQIYLLNALDIRPDWPGAWYLLGVAEEALGRRDRAAAAYAREDVAGPYAVAALTHLGRLHLRAAHLEEAEVALLRGRSLAPEDPALLVVLGDVRAAQGRFAEALELFETARAADPGATAIERRLAAVRAKLAASPVIERE
jgi:tetratricopeptide (TPR) repeat protein